METPEYWAEKLDLLPHPEGGYFKETYRAAGTTNDLPDTFPGARNFSTAIYFLLTSGNFSAFHRIKSDELWHFYRGSQLEVVVIEDDGSLNRIKLGSDIENGEVFQAVVPANCWFASRVLPEDSFALVGCTVSPGFDFADFEMAKREDLLQAYPQHEKIILELTRPDSE